MLVAASSGSGSQDGAVVSASLNFVPRFPDEIVAESQIEYSLAGSSRPGKGLSRRSVGRNEGKATELGKDFLRCDVHNLVKTTPPKDAMCCWYGSDSSPQRSQEVFQLLGFLRQFLLRRDLLVERSFVYSATAGRPLFSDGRVMVDKQMCDLFAAAVELFGSLGHLRSMGRKGINTNITTFDRGSHQDALLSIMFEQWVEEYYTIQNCFLTHDMNEQDLKDRDWTLGTGCPLHDMTNSGSRGLQPELERYLRTGSTSAAFGVTKNLSQSTFQLVSELDRFIHRRLTRIKFAEYDRPTMLSFLELFKVPDDLVHQITNLGLGFTKDGRVTVYDFYGVNDFVIIMIRICLTNILRFVAFSLSRWLTVGYSAGSFVISESFGLYTLIQDAYDHQKNVGLETYKKYNTPELRRFFVISFLELQPADRGCSAVSKDDRLFANILVVRRKILEKRTQILKLSPKVWKKFEDVINDEEAGAGIYDAVCRGMSVQLGYMDRVMFRPFRQYPHKLSVVKEGDDIDEGIRKNVETLASLPKRLVSTSDGTTRKIWRLINRQNMYNRDCTIAEVVDAVKLWRYAPISARVLEQGHSPWALIKRQHPAYTCEHMLRVGLRVCLKSVINNLESDRLDNELAKAKENTAKIMNSMPTKARVSSLMSTDARVIEEAKKERGLTPLECAAPFTEAQTRLGALTAQQHEQMQGRLRTHVLKKEYEKEIALRTALMKEHEIQLNIEEVANRSAMNPSQVQLRMSTMQIPKKQTHVYFREHWKTKHNVIEGKRLQCLLPPDASKVVETLKVEAPSRRQIRRMPQWLEFVYTHHQRHAPDVIVVQKDEKTRSFLIGDVRREMKAICMEEIKQVDVSDHGGQVTVVHGCDGWEKVLSIVKYEEAHSKYTLTGHIAHESDLFFRSCDSVKMAKACLHEGHAFISSPVDLVDFFDIQQSLPRKIFSAVTNSEAKHECATADDLEVIWRAENLEIVAALQESQEDKALALKKKRTELSRTLVVDKDDAKIPLGLKLINNSQSLKRAADIASDDENDDHAKKKSKTSTETAATDEQRRRKIEEAAFERALKKQEYSGGNYIMGNRTHYNKKDKDAPVEHDYVCIGTATNQKTFLRELGQAYEPKFATGPTRTAAAAEAMASWFISVMEQLYVFREKNDFDGMDSVQRLAEPANCAGASKKDKDRVYKLYDAAKSLAAMARKPLEELVSDHLAINRSSL